MKHQKPHAQATSPENPFVAALSNPVANVLGRSVSAFQQEGMRFMTRRLEDNMKAVEQFAACKSLPDLFAAQQKWLASMSRAYSEEMARYGELMTEVLHEGADAAKGDDTSRHDSAN